MVLYRALIREGYHERPDMARPGVNGAPNNAIDVLSSTWMSSSSLANRAGAMRFFMRLIWNRSTSTSRQRCFSIVLPRGVTFARSFIARAAESSLIG